MTDVLSTLQEASWRGISFPATQIQTSGGQDLAVHKRADRDGAFVEGTGRSPYTFRFRGVFIAETVARGTNETWDDLFPGRFLQVKDALEDRTTGVLVHPLLGPVNCKPQSWDFVVEGVTRGGCFLDMVFVETNDDADTPAFSQSERAFIKSTAIDLDSQLAALDPTPTFDPNPGQLNRTTVFSPQEEEQSFSELVDSITAAVDTTTLRTAQAVSKIDGGIAKVQRLSDSIDRASRVFSIDPTTGDSTDLGPLGTGAGRIWQNCQNMAATFRQIRERILASSTKPLGTLVLEKATMLVQVSIRTKNSTQEILELNPYLPSGKPVLPQYTLIKYYQR